MSCMSTIEQRDPYPLHPRPLASSARKIAASKMIQYVLSVALVPRPPRPHDTDRNHRDPRPASSYAPSRLSAAVTIASDLPTVAEDIEIAFESPTETSNNGSEETDVLMMNQVRRPRAARVNQPTVGRNARVLRKKTTGERIRTGKLYGRHHLPLCTVSTVPAGQSI